MGTAKRKQTSGKRTAMRNRGSETSSGGKREFDITAQSKQEERERKEKVVPGKSRAGGDREAGGWRLEAGGRRRTRDCHRRGSAVCREADAKGWPASPPLGATLPLRPCSQVAPYPPGTN